MKSTSKIKRLGDYIHQVDIRNKELSVQLLLGVSNEKYFIPSIANIVGTDLSSYKIVKFNQFAYGNVTSRNGDKISIALLKEKECIVSSSYIVFEINDTRLLNPDYLMMWFKRPEFDRYTRYMSHGSVRELFGWEKLCEVKLPIPDIEEQKRIVEDYNVIEKRIAIKEAINNNLFECGKLLLKKYYDNSSAFNDSLISLKDFCEQISSGGTPSRDNIEYWHSNDYNWLKNGEIKNNIIFDTEECISYDGLRNSSAKLISKNSVSMAMYCVSEIQVSFNCIPLTTNQAVLNFQTDSFLKSCFVYYLLATFGNELTTKANGSAQQNLSKDTIQFYQFKKPNLENIFFKYLVENMNERIVISKEVYNLNHLKSALIEQISKQ